MRITHGKQCSRTYVSLLIVPISPYSPELNIIEIVWRKIKYEWLPFSAYESIEALRGSLFEVLANIGKKYQIDFVSSFESNATANVR